MPAVQSIARERRVASPLPYYSTVGPRGPLANGYQKQRQFQTGSRAGS